MGNRGLERYREDHDYDELKKMNLIYYTKFLEMLKKDKPKNIQIKKHLDIQFLQRGCGMKDFIYFSIIIRVKTQHLQNIQKAPQEEKLQTLFHLYDMDNKGYIDKTDFLKMLYNYPQNDIKDLYNEIKEIQRYLYANKKESQFYMSTLLNVDSSNNQGKAMHNNEFLQRINSNIFNISYQENSNNSYNNTQKSKDFLFPLDQLLTLPTSFNNKLKVITNMIYIKYGQDNKMSIKGFSKWIHQHPKFLDKINYWFRTQIWQSYFNEKVQRRLLSFHKNEADLQMNLKIQKYHSINRSECYAQVFDIFLFIFLEKSENDYENPDKVFVLQGLTIGFNDEKQKIYISFNKKYEGIKLQIVQPKEYKIWKNYFDKFNYEKHIKNYQISDKLGKGKFSVVYSAIDNADKECAIKIIQKKNLSEDEKQVLANEKKIMKVLNHPNVIKFIESWETNATINHVIELIKGSDLYSFYHENAIDEVIARQIFIQIVDSLYYLHSLGILHRDLKPENIMIKKTNGKLQCKIIDFGFAVYVEQLNDETLRAGTPNFIAPEVLQLKEFGFQSDVFSLGVILYFLLTGQFPYDHEDNEIIAEKSIKEEYDLETKELEIVTDEAKDLIKKLLKANPKERINLKDIFTHKWIKCNLNELTDEKQKYLQKYDESNLKKFI